MGSEVDHLVFVTLGTGIGGGVITHGVLMRGAQGSGGELGPRDGPGHGAPLRLRQRGCLEALASGTAIARRAREVAIENPGSALGRLATNRQILGEDVTRLAREGDEVALSVLEETGRWLGIGLACFVNIFNPEVVAVGGGAMEAGELILEAARREVSPARQAPVSRPRRGTESPPSAPNPASSAPPPSPGTRPRGSTCWGPEACPSAWSRPP